MELPVKGTKCGIEVFVGLSSQLAQLGNTNGSKVLRVILNGAVYRYDYQTPDGFAIGSYDLGKRIQTGFESGAKLDFYPPARTPCDRNQPEFTSRLDAVELICNGKLILVDPKDLPFKKTWQ